MKIRERQRSGAIRKAAMENPFAHPNCSACGFEYPPIVHLHHVKPLCESEAIDETLEWLCPNCHALVHEIRKIHFLKNKVSNIDIRINHLDYYLYEICKKEIRDKLFFIAKGNK